MTVLEELEKREKEIKGLLELSESLDERKALRSELRDIRRKIFDVPSSGNTTTTVTVKQPVETAVTKNITSKIEETKPKESVGSTKMSNSRNRFQKVDDNNNNNETRTETGSTRRSIGTKISPPEPKEESKVETEGEKTKGKVFVTLNKPNEKQNTDGNSAIRKVEEKNESQSSGIRRTATWAHKNQGSITKKFEPEKTNNKFKFGAQVGQSPFQFGIDYREKQKVQSIDKPKYTGYSKYTPTVESKNKFLVSAHARSAKKEGEEEEEKPYTNAPAHNDSSTAECKPASYSKYITSYNSNKKEEKVTESPQGRSQSTSSLGLTFTQKTGNNDLIKRFEPTQNPSSERPTPSFNKYVASLNRTNDKNQAAKNIIRSFSLRARPTYETASSAPAEPSNFAVKYKQSKSIPEQGKNETSNTSNTSCDLENLKISTSASRTSTYLSKKTSQPSSTVPPSKTPTPSQTKKTVETPSEPSDNPLAAFGAGGAADRMAFFRQAAQKEKEAAEKKKEKEEQRRKQLEAMTALVNGEIEQANEKDKESKSEESTKSPTRKESAKKEIPDSEKMKNATAPCMKKREKKKVVRRTMSIGNIVLDWVQEMIKDYPVEVTNFSSSWNDGMAFCALIHRFNPDEFDFSELKPENKRQNFDLAFNTGMKVKNIPILLDTEDMVVMKKPEPRSVQTYIQWIWSVYGPTSGYGPTPQEVQK